jgi:hypothetical protein
METYSDTCIILVLKTVAEESRGIPGVICWLIPFLNLSPYLYFPQSNGKYYSENYIMRSFILFTIHLTLLINELNNSMERVLSCKLDICALGQEIN